MRFQLIYETVQKTMDTTLSACDFWSNSIGSSIELRQSDHQYFKKKRF